MMISINDKEISGLRNFKAENINDAALEKIIPMSKKIRKDILTMINNAGSGHVGGSLSSTDIYLMLWLCADITTENFNKDERDRIVISHGHTSSALYSVLGNFDFFEVQEAVENFRKQKSIFEGHPNCLIPGVEWCSGSLGQGLSVGCGFALASKLQKQNNRVYVVMGDGEQQKGQITEAREFAAMHHLSNLTAIIDLNKLQSSGKTDDIMHCDIQKKYESSGWKVISVDGHNYRELYQALKSASVENERPVAILANTVMGKGVSFIENNYEYHGRVLSAEQFQRAIKEIGEVDIKMTTSPGLKEEINVSVESKINIGNPVNYPADKPVECRTAAGEAIYDIVKNNSHIPIAVLDCDLSESVKTSKILKGFSNKLIQCGIQEHNATTVSGALSKAGVLTFFLDFGVFGIDETYGQHRMNDFNGTSIKLIGTHCGLDVGEDGKTHQCIDYISLINNLPGYKLIIPADANQTDRAIRYIASTPGNFVVIVGRSKIPVIRNERNEPFYSEKYSFSYGNADWIREGNDATIITTGTMTHKAVEASESLFEENIHAGVLNISSPGKLDMNAIQKACKTGTVITYEDHLVQSGMGSIVASLIAEYELKCHFKRIGIVKYGKSCTPDEQYLFQGLDIKSLQQTIRILLKRNNNHK